MLTVLLHLKYLKSGYNGFNADLAAVVGSKFVGFKKLRVLRTLPANKAKPVKHQTVNGTLHLYYSET